MNIVINDKIIEEWEDEAYIEGDIKANERLSKEKLKEMIENYLQDYFS